MMMEHTLHKKEKIVTKWLVFYTSPRAEKVIYKKLIDKGYEVFLPLQKKFKIWKNRQRKFIDEPLFPSYIFVKIRPFEIYDVLKIFGICMCIVFEGKPCTVPDKDIEAIQAMLLLEQEISSDTNFSKGEKVLVISGPLSGYEGILFEQKGKNKFGIQINEVNLIASIDIAIKDIQKLAQN
jgi:transcription antitermination factor NusG